MNIYKFGGASVKDAQGVKNVCKIIQQHGDKQLLVVVSAIGKNTNLLEKVVDAYFTNRHESIQLFAEVIKSHIELATTLSIDLDFFNAEIDEIIASVEWLLEVEPEDPYNYVYDQIVSSGELLSSKLLNAYLLKMNVASKWMDVRDIIITDDTYREAKVNWTATEENIKRLDLESDSSKIYIFQGFIGSTTDNNTTTLGREGSDFTGAILAYCSNAEGLYIWKNVEGVLTGDPTRFEHVTKIDRLSYKEAIEMTYYGAKVIHPKTIKPLQNKMIPLYVKSFIDPEGSGTIVSANDIEKYPPVVVVEPSQALIHISTRDFSFVAEEHITEIFSKISELRIKVNLMRNTAISFTLCVKLDQDKIERLVTDLKTKYQVVLDFDLSLYTIRHYTDDVVNSLKSGQMILFEERLENMIQMVLKSIPVMSPKN